MRPTLAFLIPFLLLGCATTGGAKKPAEPAAPPAAEELMVAGGWEATLVHDNQGIGVWTVESFPVFPDLGCPDIVGLDDRGRLLVNVMYGGRWSLAPVIHDHEWLGGLAHGEIDPRVEGPEVYTGGKRGNLYQVGAFPGGVLDCRRIAHLPGREIHILVAGDFDPRTPGREVLAFTNPGGLFRLTPTGPDGRFETEHLMDLVSRVRDAVVLPAAEGEPPAVVTATRGGRLEMLRNGADGPQWSVIHEERMGMGRVALRPPEAGQPLVLYSTLEDGRVLRHEQDGTTWKTETIHRGPAGPRGVTAGRFAEDPGTETVAVFGYGMRVEVRTRGDEGWTAETIFTDTDKGHWMATAEVDGRNGTREIVTCGYSGRIVLLSRPPGYGLSD